MRRLLLVVCLVAAAALAALPSPAATGATGGAGAATGGPGASRLAVFADIAPLAGLARLVGGDRVRVSVLVPPGRDPHTFEPTPRQLTALASARLFVGLGLPFEKRLATRLAQINPGLELVDAAAGIQRIPLASGGEGGGHGRGEPDPHLWLDPLRGARIAANLARAFSAADPAGRDAYQANLERLRARLQDLDARLRQVLAPYRGREFLVFHPALGYLAHAYGLKQVAIQAGGREPGPRRLARLIQLARAKGIRIIFVEPQFPQAQARALARAIGGAVVTLDPLAPDYLQGLERLAAELARALAGEKRP